MAALLDRLSTAGPPLWLDSVAYASCLLAGDAPPWLDAAAFAAWQRKAQGLLKSDVLAVPLAPMIAAWLDAHADLRTAMTGKKRATYALKTLLANEALRIYLVSAAAALRGSAGSLPLVLQMPSPRSWVSMTFAQAHGTAESIEIGPEEIDAAAVLVADFLRTFGDSGIAGLLLEEAEGNEPADAAALGWYQPIINVAAHYRWDVGVRFPSAEHFSGGVAGLGFVIAPRALTGALAGLSTTRRFWSGEEAAAALVGAGFRHAEIPAESVPEQVLERLALLRRC